MKNPATNTISYRTIKISWLNLRLLINIRRPQFKIITRNLGILKINHLQIKTRKINLSRSQLRLIQKFHQLIEIATKSLHV
jgi:hypothetical protein